MMALKYDIVYMVKDSEPNEELRYSLRSIEKNWEPWHAFTNIRIFGGCPDYIYPTQFIPIEMDQPGKWENTHMVMRKICECDDVSEDFWFFNDDFFVMKPVNEETPQMVNGTLQDVIELVEGYEGGVTYWTEQLHILVDLFTREPENFGTGFVNYEVHKPMLINRKKMLKVMELYPDILFTRSLYGNYYNVCAVNSADVMIKHPDQNIKWIKKLDPTFISTTEESFAKGKIGNYIRERFTKPCVWEANE